MPVSTAAVGKEYPPTTYEVGIEKIREYLKLLLSRNGFAVHPSRHRLERDRAPPVDGIELPFEHRGPLAETRLLQRRAQPLRKLFLLVAHGPELTCRRAPP